MRPIDSICLCLLACLMTCCKARDNACSVAQQYFFKRVDKIDLSQFYGLYITLRGKNSDGSMRIRAIELRLENGERIGIPGYEFDVKEASPDVFSNIIKFAKHFGQKEEDAMSFCIEYCRKMTKIVNKLRVQEIKSNLELGEFIIFRFSSDCALVYKKKNANVKNSKWQSVFSDKNKISEQWYFLKF
ncbi:hypothetical protein [Haliscomenobacter hydrossis]|uniref:Lipoprotein n=1 Tax=Haliscomenobacter hydrossis (strain ATCC 27775 / DSM 1100 / LMG 10767 / O) TaxID=760192 RepID=F4L3A6_HALH1|nr:hypothetical protein [Haliscomenobacter hydrossis]AEE51740.1 hypothetical protein Halhy_3890 [Haliscomenobacter hydrossis DSM 1100]